MLMGVCINLSRPFPGYSRVKEELRVLVQCNISRVSVFSKVVLQSAGSHFELGTFDCSSAPISIWVNEHLKLPRHRPWPAFPGPA